MQKRSAVRKGAATRRFKSNLITAMCLNVADFDSPDALICSLMLRSRGTRHDATNSFKQNLILFKSHVKILHRFVQLK